MPARTLLLGTLLAVSGAAPLPAQLIAIRTIPVSQSHQFDLFPSLRMGMGGVSVAVDDSLNDAFSNPAKGGRLHLGRFYGSPGLYSVSKGAGAGRSLPVGAWMRSGKWFGGAAAAVQQMDLSDNVQFNTPVPVCLACDIAFPPAERPSRDQSHGNVFGYGMLGRSVPSLGLSVAASVFWAGLHGVDGVDLLYPGSVGLDQSGHSVDMRFGALKEWEGGKTLSAVLVHSRYSVHQSALFLDGFWDPGIQQFSQRPRLDENQDQTNVWGAHFEYSTPLRTPGWRVGWVATTNLMSHPKIPNYQIQNIPRDPGNSQAFNFGVGMAKSTQAAVFAMDLILEPIWSHTWADALTPQETESGNVIPVGGKTIENRFRFSNAQLRMGFSQDVPLEDATKQVGFQLGLAVHRIAYAMTQYDRVAETRRALNQDWVEWTPTWGLSLRFPAWELRYRGSVTNGTGRPGVRSDVIMVATPQTADAGPILVAPSGPLTLAGVRVMTHQVSISFPFR